MSPQAAAAPTPVRHFVEPEWIGPLPAAVPQGRARRILLVGFDNSYVQPSTVREGDTIAQVQDDPNHFLKDYFKGKTWQAADTGNMNDSYCEALGFAMAHDVEIINCTVGGQLHVFPRASLSGALHGDDQAPPGLPGRGRWARLTPGEVVAIMCHPAQMPAETRTSYAGLPEAVGRTLLDEARQSGRQAPAPHRHLAGPD